MFTKADVKNQLKNMGIKHNDVVLIHISYKSVGDVENGIDGFIDAFKEYLCDGLFIIPTHTWKVVNKENPLFEVDKTIPNIGAVPMVAAFRVDGVRSLHPTHSVWCVGKNANEFVKGEELSKTPTPVGGVMERLYHLNAKILLIGVGHERNTYIHSVDEYFNLNDRLADFTFNVKIVDKDGNFYEHEYRPHGVHGAINFSNFEDLFVFGGAQTEGCIGNAKVKVIDAKKCRDILSKVYSKTTNNLCLESNKLNPNEWL